MPDISVLKKSRFLSKADVGNGILLTIRNVEQLNVSAEGAEPEMKWCMIFEESEKPMPLNSTNAQLIAQYSGRQNTDTWTGLRTVVYFDPNVSYGGKLMGGLRCRAPRPQAPAGQPIGKPAPATAAPAEQEESGGDVPF